MTELPAPAPADAKAVWESFKAKGKKPSVRLVTEALNASKTFSRTTPATVGRWKKAGWTRKQAPTRTSALDEAAAKVSAAVPALTGDATTRTEDLVGKPGAPDKGTGGSSAPTGQGDPNKPEDDDARKKRLAARRAALEALPLDKLVETAARAQLVNVVMLSELQLEKAEQGGKDSPESDPRGYSGLQQALAGSAGVATDNVFKLIGQQAGLVDLKPVEQADGTIVHEAMPDPLADVMAEIKKAEDEHG